MSGKVRHKNSSISPLHRQRLSHRPLLPKSGDSSSVMSGIVRKVCHSGQRLPPASCTTHQFLPFSSVSKLEISKLTLSLPSCSYLHVCFISKPKPRKGKSGGTRAGCRPLVLNTRTCSIQEHTSVTYPVISSLIISRKTHETGCVCVSNHRNTFTSYSSQASPSNKRQDTESAETVTLPKITS